MFLSVISTDCSRFASVGFILGSDVDDLDELLVAVFAAFILDSAIELGTSDGTKLGVKTWTGAQSWNGRMEVNWDQNLEVEIILVVIIVEGNISIA